ncbi:MAG: PKD domain-containing protein [Flavobacteriales bacterium]|nr:PKD domain-containing protein [Flavobacteriales bacterium]
MRILLATLFAFWSCLLLGQVGPCDQVQAGFSAQVNGAVVQFSNTTIGTGDGTLFFWNFGDGTTSQDPQPTHDYGLYGSYEVCLTVVTIVQGPNGQPITCDDDYCQLVQAGPVPICSPDFLVAMDAQPQANGLVTFIATSTFQNTNFIWYFGDGAQAFGPTANHTYAEDGTYGVCVMGWYFNEATQDTCWIEDCEPVEVSGTPCNGLESCFVTNDLGDGMYFFDNCSAQGGIAQYFWDFGDGTSSTAVNAEHLYELPGVYSVCLVVYEGNCVDSTCTTITIAGPCDPLAANFGWSLAGAQAEFDNVTVPVGLSTTWLWNFGDGSSSTENSPSHLYTAPGAYQACLTATSLLEGGYLCTDTYCVTVVVQGGSPCQTLQADFGSFTQGLGVELVNSSFGLGFQTSYFWTFGDGQSSAAPSPAHVYDVPGTYQVCLTVISLYNSPGGTITCQDIYCAPVVILGDQPCDPNFAVELAWNAGPNNTVFLTGGSNRPNTNFIWYLGDGSEAYGSSVSHTYAEGGNYTVCLAGWYFNEATSDSCWAEDCAIITVGGGNPCESLQACFVTNELGNGGYFFDNCTGGPLGTQYFWSFGDGATSSGTNVDHQYSEPGTYEVCLTAFGQLCSDTTCTMVTVFGDEPCDPNFAVELGWNAGLNNTVFLSGSSNVPETYFIWYLGDGSEAYGTSVTHTYAQPGTYTVCMAGWYNNIFSGDSCWAEDCAIITVGGGNPCDSLLACFEPLTLPNNIIYFENCSSAPAGATYFWDFGDGDTFTGPLIEHIYQPGTYTACLVVTWENCVDSTCATFTVGGGDFCDGLQACFQPEPFENGVYFFSNCSQPLPIAIPVSYFWNFGDGSTSTNAQPDHAFAPGTYTICLTVTQGDCVDTTCVTISVGGGLPCDQHQADFTTTSDGLAILFTSTSTGTGPNTEYFWSFGDGAVAGGPNPVHDYAVQGVYEVCLVISTVWEAFPGQPVTFCQDSVCYTVDVGFNDFCDQLQACFLPLPFENGAYLFENCSQVLPIDIPAYAYWDFGDGATSTEWVPTHAFAPGIYSVCLTVVHGECVDTTCTTITVSGGPGCDPNYTASFTYTVQNNAVIFQADFDTPTLGVVWTFPGGDQAYEPVHTQLFEPPGPFEVCLSTWYWSEQTQDSCWAHTCQLIDPFNTSTAVDENGSDPLRIYPVPAHDRITIEGTVQGTAVQLFSADGRLISTTRSTSDMHQVDVHGLAPGAYVLTVEQDGARTHHRVVVE